MNFKLLNFLFYASIILVVISLTIFLSNQINTKKPDQSLLVEDFDNILTKLNNIKFSTQEHQTIINKGSNGWVLTSHDNFPANAEELRKFFYNLREAKIIDLKTAKENRHYKLGLDLASKINLSLADINGDELKNFDIGVYNYLVGGTYLKEPNSNQTFLISSNLGTDAEGFHWMSPYLLNIAPNNIDQLTIMQPFKKKKSFKRNEVEELVMITPPDKSVDEFIIKNVETSLQDIEIEGYILKDNLEKLSPILKTEYNFLNQSSLTMNYYNLDESIFITLKFRDIPDNFLPLQKKILETFNGDEFEISSNALLDYGFQIKEMNYDNLNIKLD